MAWARLQPLAFGIDFDVVPAVRHMVAGQEHLDLVAAIDQRYPITRASDV